MIKIFNSGDKVTVNVSKGNIVNGIICEKFQEEEYAPFFYSIDIGQGSKIFHYDWDIEFLNLEKERERKLKIIKHTEIDPFGEEIW